MNDRQIQDAIASLDQEVPRDQARVAFHQYGGGPDEGMMIANQTGFLRLGVELLKAAYAPIEGTGESGTVKIDIAYLVTSDSTIGFNWFERRKHLEEPEPVPKTPRFIPALVLSVLAAGVILAVIGLFAVLRWLAA